MEWVAGAGGAVLGLEGAEARAEVAALAQRRCEEQRGVLLRRRHVQRRAQVRERVRAVAEVHFRGAHLRQTKLTKSEAPSWIESSSV